MEAPQSTGSRSGAPCTCTSVSMVAVILMTLCFAGLYASFGNGMWMVLRSLSFSTPPSEEFRASESVDSSSSTQQRLPEAAPSKGASVRKNQDDKAPASNQQRVASLHTSPTDSPRMNNTASNTYVHVGIPSKPTRIQPWHVEERFIASRKIRRWNESITCDNFDDCIDLDKTEENELGVGWGKKVYKAKFRCSPLVEEAEGIEIAVKVFGASKIGHRRGIEERTMNVLSGHPSIPIYFGECERPDATYIVVERSGSHLFGDRILPEYFNNTFSTEEERRTAALFLAWNLISMFEYIEEQHKLFLTDVYSGQIFYFGADKHFRLMLVDLDHLRDISPPDGFRSNLKCSTEDPSKCSRSLGMMHQHLAPEMYGLCAPNGLHCIGADSRTHAYMLSVRSRSLDACGTLYTLQQWLPELQGIIPHMSTPSKYDRPLLREVLKFMRSVFS